MRNDIWKMFRRLGESETTILDTRNPIPFFLFHGKRPTQESPTIGNFFNDLRSWFAGAVTSLRFYANQDRRGSRLSILQCRCEFETVSGPNAIIMISSGYQGWWIHFAGFDVMQRRV